MATYNAIAAKGRGKSLLPGWLLKVRQTLPGWVDRLRHPDGPGRYRFAVDAYEPYDLNSSCLMRCVIDTIGYPCPASERQAWAEYLRNLQRPEDGLMIDPAIERCIAPKGDAPTDEEIFNVRRWTTRNGISAILLLGGKPRYRLAHEETFETPEQMVRYLEGLHWHNPWGAGSWAGAVIKFQHFNRLLGDERAEDIIRAGVDWLARRQDPETGAWSDGSAISLHRLINGIFKVWIQVLPIADLPVQYPEKVVDLCIRGLREDPVLSGAPDACSIFDVALVLDVALRHCSHRREEVADLARRHVPMLEPMVRPDGAFSYGPETSLPNHGGLALAPPEDQSDAAGTALNVQAIALLANLGGLRDELGWAPTTEHAMGLPGADAPGTNDG